MVSASDPLALLPPGDGTLGHVVIGDVTLVTGVVIPAVTLAVQRWGRINSEKSNVVLVEHALTGDSHVVGPVDSLHPTPGWWNGLVGPGLPLDTDRYCVVSVNVLGGCRGSTGPSSLHPDGHYWGARFPAVSVRDMVTSERMLADLLGIDRWAAVIGGSMGAMQSLEWAITHPDRVERLAVLAGPAVSTADQIALSSIQVEAIRADPAFAAGDYYDAADGEGPHRGLALARRIALLSYRAKDELNHRFARSWQSARSPLGEGGRYAVESYLDFHGNKFTRRFDANAYITLVAAMSSHDVGRDRGGVDAALATVRVPTLVLAIDTDRLFPVDDQERIAAGVPGNLDGDEPHRVASEFGHDAFLIESTIVGAQLQRLLAA